VFVTEEMLQDPKFMMSRDGMRIAAEAARAGRIQFSPRKAGQAR
jgi:hypothetical protein